MSSNSALINISLFFFIIINQWWKRASKKIYKNNITNSGCIYLLHLIIQAKKYSNHILNLIIICLFRKCYQYIFIFKISFSNDDDKMY